MKKVVSRILLLVVCSMLFVTLASNHGVFHLLSINDELNQLQEQNNVAESEIIELNNKIAAIKQSEDALEKTAREQLGLSKPGEIVYIFSDSLSNKTFPDR